MSASLLLEPPQPPVPPRRSGPSTACELHPEEPVTGFCASCLRERLAGLDPSFFRSSSGAAGRKSTSAIKSIFLSRLAGVGSGGGEPDLRRCKSFSFSGARAGPILGGSFSPARHSYDIRGRNTLWSLFHQDDHDRFRGGGDPIPASSSHAVEAINAGEEIVPAVESTVAADAVVISQEIEPVEEEQEHESDDIELPPPPQPKRAAPSKDLKEMAAGSFWLAASVFSKKWHKWRRKQKLKKQQSGSAGGSRAAAAAMPPPPGKPPRPSILPLMRRQKRHDSNNTEFGRRSCDTDPRFSLDAGRMSVDDAGGFSWDEPRASWDGYLIGARPVLARSGLLSVIEDKPAPPFERPDAQIPVEEDSLAAIPGGSLQTKDYYATSRNRRSFERSNSMRRPSFEVGDDAKLSGASANGNVSSIGKGSSPVVAGMEFYHLHHVGSYLDRELSSNSFRNDFSGSLESSFCGPRKSVPPKKTRRWVKGWNFWGLIHRRSSQREIRGDEGIVERSLSETWPELRVRGFNPKLQRSNSCTSSRTGIEMNRHMKKKREESVFDGQRSSRYSPGRVNGGMSRYYLPPMRSGRKNYSGLPSGKGRHMTSHHAFASSMLRMY